jgi:membrane associated rhomboid family serine protease
MTADRPWEDEALFPPSPADGTYGFLSGGKLKRCTADELAQACSVAQIPDVALVWTPAHPRLVPKAEVDALTPALEERLRSAIKLAGFSIAGGLLMAWLNSAGPKDRRTWPIWLVLLVVPNVQGLADSVASLRALRRRKTLGLPPERDDATRFAFWIGSRRSRVTKALAIGIVTVALCQLWRGIGLSVADAGLVKDAVRHGEVWRLLTAGMLHANVWHLAGNMGALLAFGQLVEVLAHWSRLVVVFVLSILVGSLFSMVLLPHASSVGASGGLMGLLGFLIVVGMRAATFLPPRFGRSLISGVLWVAATGLIAYAFIDNAAHAGGLLAGIALGLLLVPRTAVIPLTASPRMRAIGLAFGSVCLAVILATIALLVRA